MIFYRTLGMSVIYDNKLVLGEDTTLGSDLTVDGTTLTVPAGATLEFDFKNNKITVKTTDGKILTQLGGKTT